jgi:hypothetical protein
MAISKLGILLGLAGVALAQTHTGWETGPFFTARTTGDAIHYAAKAPGWAADFADSRVTFTHQGAAVAIDFVGARAGVAPQARRRMSGKANFFLAQDSAAWRTAEPVYREILYRGLYPGIDLVYGGSAGRLKAEFHVAPHADPSLIRLHYTGVGDMQLNARGALVAVTAKGRFHEQPPVLYQRTAGKHTRVPGAFRIFGDSLVGFEIGEYDHSQALVIDPVIALSTYVGGSGMDAATAVAADHSGNIYIAGWTDSSDLPIYNASLPEGSGVDAFVAKWNPAGVMQYCTYIGGSGADQALAIAVDSSGNAYVTGATASHDFPTMSALQANLAGSQNAFMVKLNAAGVLAQSTYLGGNGTDSGNGIALDSAGNITLAGSTTSVNFPVQNAYQSSRRGATNIFVTRLNASGAMVFSTYLGGSGADHAAAVAVDSSEAVYVTGTTTSANFPVLNAYQPTISGGQSAFVAKLSGTGTLTYSTYLGGQGATIQAGAGIAVDSTGNAYIAGTTNSGTFPVVNAVQNRFSGNEIDAFATKLNPAGNALVYSTYLGGSSLNYGTSIAVDSKGDAWVAGYTSSIDFPVFNPLRSANSGGYDGFVAELNPTGTAFVQSTYLGGSGNDAINAIAVDPWGSAYVAGQTMSSNFPAVNATQPANGGSLDAFVARLAPPSQFAGNYDTATCTAISGWAWDTSNPFNTVNVDILNGTILLATVPANMFRADLVGAGIGNGYHGFSYTPPSSVKTGQPVAITVRYSNTIQNMGGSPKSMTCSTSMAGTQQSVSCSTISGWAWDSSNPSNAINVDILNGTTLLGTVSAGIFSESLLTSGIGNGAHAFSFPTPISIEDGTTHTITARISGTTFNLAGTPMPLTCQPPAGHYDSTSCSSISGWAWDPNNPNTPINVDILNAGNLVATIPAGNFRADLLAAGKGNGYHGFTFPTPSALDDGQPHTISVRISQTADLLPGSPQTLKCGTAVGVNDTTNCSVIGGWAWNPSSPATALNIDILNGAALLATVPANLFRQDLLNDGIGTGNYGFVYPTPAVLMDGKPHTIVVRFSGSTTPLGGSSKTLQCSQ